MANTDYRAEQLVASVRLMIGRRVAGLAAIVSEMATGADRRVNRKPHPGGLLRRRRAAPQHHQHSRQLPARHGEGDRLSAQPGPPPPRVHRPPCGAGADQRAHESGDGRGGAHSRARSAHRRRRRYAWKAAARPAAPCCHGGFDPTAIHLRQRHDWRWARSGNCASRGIRVPEDISVTGFDNVKLSEFCYPALTTVHIPRDRIGHIVCDT